MRVLSIVLCAAFLFVAPVVASASPAPAEMIAKTELPKISATSATLAHVLAHCSKLTGAKIDVNWKSLDAAGVRPESKVKVAGKKLTFSQVLDLTLASLGKTKEPVVWAIHNGAFRITTQADLLNTRRARAAQMSRARHLLRPARASKPTPKTKPARPTAVRSIDFDETPLSDALAFLRDHARVNMVVRWRALEAAGIDKDAAVTLNAKNVSFTSALDLVCEAANGVRGLHEQVFWVSKNGIITVTSGADLDSRMVTHVFDVSEMLVGVPIIPGPGIGLTKRSSSGTTGGGGAGANIFGTDDRSNTGKDNVPSESEQRDAIRKNLIASVKATLPQEFWTEGNGKGSVSLLRGTLVIRQSELGFKLMTRAIARR